MTITATAENAFTPPRVRVDVALPTPGGSMQSVTLWRIQSGVREPVAEQPTLGLDARTVYDYRMAYEVPCTYQWEATYLDPSLFTPVWEERWADLDDWDTSPGFQVDAFSETLLYVDDQAVGPYASRAVTPGRYQIRFEERVVGYRRLDFGSFVIDFRQRRIGVALGGGIGGGILGSPSVPIDPGAGPMTIDVTTENVAVTTTAGTFSLNVAGLLVSRVLFADPFSDLQARTELLDLDADGLAVPSSIAFDVANEWIYVADFEESAGGCAHRYRADTGELLCSWILPGAGTAQARGIESIAVDPDGVVYTLARQAGGSRVQKWTLTGGPTTPPTLATSWASGAAGADPYNWSGSPNASTSIYTPPTGPTVTNLATNPSFEATSGTVEIRRNLTTNPELGADATGYSIAGYGTGGAGSAARVAGTGPDGVAAYVATWSASPSSGGADVGFGSGGSAIQPVTAGTVYTLSAFGRRSTAGPLAGRVYFYDNAGALVGLTEISPLTVAAGEWKRLSATVTAPAGATRARMAVRVSDVSGVPVGFTLSQTRTLVEASPALGDYFAGGTAAAGDFTFAWTGTANASASIQRGVGVAGVTAPSDTAIYQSTEWSESGSASVRLTPRPGLGSGTALRYGNAAALPFGIEPGKTYTMIATCRLVAAQTGSLDSRARRLRAYWSFDNVTFVPWVESEQAPNAAGESELRLTFTVPVGVTGVLLMLGNGASFGNGDVWWDDFALIEGTYTGDYFDGDSFGGEHALGGQIATNGTGNILVPIRDESRVRIFTNTGTLLTTIAPTIGDAAGNFRSPAAVEQRNSTWLEVIDSVRNRRIVFDPSDSYAYRFEFGVTGLGAGQLQSPVDVSFDDSGNPWIADAEGRFQHIVIGGQVIDAFTITPTRTFPGQQGPRVSAPDGGRVFVLSAIEKRVYVAELTPPGAGPVEVVAYGASDQSLSETSDPVTIEGVSAWIIHPAKPSLSIPIDYSDTDETTFAAFGSVRRRSTSSRFDIIGQKLAVSVSSGPRPGDETSIMLGTETTSQRTAIEALIDDQVPLLVRIPPSWGLDFADGFYDVGDVDLARQVQVYDQPSRMVALPLVAVEAPLVTQQNAGWSLAALLAAFSTLEQVQAAYATNADLLVDERLPGF